MIVETTNRYASVRSRIVEYVNSELVGPRFGIDEELPESPHKRYLSGILYPQTAEVDREIAEDEVDDSQTTANARNRGGDEGDLEETASILSNQFLPSSLGISFSVTAVPEFLADVTFGTYIKKKVPTENNGRRSAAVWERQHWSFEGVECHQPSEGHTTRVELVPGKVHLEVVWRSIGSGWLVTTSLVNLQKSGGSANVDGEKCVCQPKITVRPTSRSRIVRLPRQRAINDDLEQQRLDLMYLDRAPFGSGHGCSVTWHEGAANTAIAVESAIIPQQTVPALGYSLKGFNRLLRVSSLAHEDELDDFALFTLLEKFIDAYEQWCNDEASGFGEVPSDLESAFDDIVRRQKIAVNRMRAGVALLRSNGTALRAFRMANEAMLNQMLQSSRAGIEPPSRSETKRLQDLRDEEPAWRPFQLAFQIMTVGSVISDEDIYRDIVDLIWFPTGGGKTEAYLAMTATSILYRRLVSGDQGAGTAVIMRYTLRLLTSQQFERASRLICALEDMRRRDPVTLGSTPITIGLWVGQGLTPNKTADAITKYEELLESDRPEPLFQVQACPWCGARMVPRHRSENSDDYGYLVSAGSFRFRCPNNACDFHDGLPIDVVDDSLYKNPPSLLLGTIDKFAWLPREPRADNFFGALGHRPPDLIIQDELHLISGPLGSIAGIYEMALDGLISLRGYSPKVIAATATARRADEQSRALYGRRAEVFPPSGLSARNSYFAREVTESEKPGRLYLGVLAQGHSGSTAMVRLSAALLQAPKELELTGELLDAYWTLVGYHNSLRELGKSITFAADDIPARIRVIASDPDHARMLKDDENVRELTSNLNGQQLSDVLYRLDHEADHSDEISFLMSTNMLSVGVDIDRLGLMLVNGQPKTTAEYIQATSRVGRSKVPGLVYTLYSPTKPRDRSHYEKFVAYHTSLYSGVEPTSVTPFSEPARDRALHAALVTLVRYLAMQTSENNAAPFNSQLPLIREIETFILQRIRTGDPREAASAESQIQALLDEWEERAKTTPTLLFDSGSRQYPVLLIEAIGDKRDDGWPTLRSMRNVDASTPVIIVGATS